MANIDSLEINITASADKAVPAINQLVASLEKLDAALSKLNVKEFTGQMSKLSNSMTTMSKSATTAGQKLNATGNATKNVGNSFRSASMSTGSFISSLKRIIPHTTSLTSAFMSLYAKLFLLRRAFSLGLKAINIASDLTEVQNVVDTTFGDMAYKLEDFAKTSRQTFGLSELSAKQYASQFQSMFKAMGISAEQVSEVNSRLAEDSNRAAMMMSKGYDVMNNDVSDMSLNLTKLAADMASFYNQEAADVAARLQAGVISGQSRALRQYGLDLTLATLQEYAMSKGIQTNIAEMTQAQKTMLRYQYALERLSHVQGDFSKTVNTWANQIKLLKQNFQALGSIIGSGLINAFKPAIMKINSAMNTIIKLVEKAMNAIGKLLGWQIEIQEVGTSLDDMDEALEGAGGGGSGGGTADDLEDAADGADDAAAGADDLADALTDAQKAAKKLKDYTLGIDELNIFHPDEETDELEDLADAIDDVGKASKDAADNGGGSGGGGASGGGSGASMPVSGGGFSMRRYESDIDSWFELGRKISDTLTDMMDSIDWYAIYEKARNFGKNLAEFLTGLITPSLFGALGRTIASALNAALHVLDSFGETFDWKNFGHSIAVGINNFFATFDFKLAASTANKWIKGILDALITAIQDTNWYQMGQKIGEMIAEIDFKGILARIGRLIWEAINAAFDLYKGIFDAAPLETTLATIFAGIILTTNKKTSRIVEIAIGAVQSVIDGVKSIPGAFQTFDTVYSGTGSPVQALNAAIGGISDKLKAVAKVVGGVVTAFLEFNTVRSSIRNLITDTGDWVTEIGKIAVAVGGAFIAFTFLTGSLQGGALATAISGIAGAIAGVVEGVQQLQSESIQNAFSGMIQATEGVGPSLDELVIKFEETVQQITAKIEAFNQSFDALETSKSEIVSVSDTLNSIGTAMEASTQLTQTQVGILEGEFQKLATMMSEYITQSYNVAIQQQMIDMQILESHGKLTAAQKDAYTERIANMYLEQQAAIDSSNAQISAVQATIAAYQEAVATYGADSEQAIAAFNAIKEALGGYQSYLSDTGVVTNEVSQITSEAVGHIEELGKKIDFSKTSTDSLPAVLDKAKESVQNMGNEAKTAQGKIEEYANTVTEQDTEETIALRAEAAEEAFGDVVDAYNQGFNDIQDSVISGVSDVITTAETEWDAAGGKGLGFQTKEEYVQAAINDYVTNFVKPLDEEMQRSMNELGLEQSTYALDACEEIAKSLFNVETYQNAGFGAPHLKIELRDDYIEVIQSVGEDAKAEALTAGGYIAEGFGNGVTENISKATDPVTQMAEDSIKAAEDTLGEHSPSKIFKGIGEYVVAGFNDGITGKSSETTGVINTWLNDIKTTMTTGIETMSTALSTSISTMLSNAFTSAMPNLTTTIVEALNLFFTETLPPYFTIEMWEPLFTLFYEMLNEQFLLFREWFNTEAMTVWWTEDLMSWFTWDKWNPDVFAMIDSHYKKAWNTFLTWWRTSMKNWWTVDLKPWFTWDKWNPDVFEMIVTHYKLAWKNFLEWWRASMKAWWQDDVKPWFTATQWFPDVFDMIESHYNKAWEEFISWWRSSMEEWWDKDVIPWFEYDKWYEQFEHIYDAAEAVFEAVAEVIREKMQEAEDACREACEAMMEMINAVIEAADAAIAKMEQLMAMAASIGSIGGGIPGFAAGGFPETGSLFFANEAGPELVGTINGNTAVANHGEITGIRDAVYQTGQVETQLLTQIVGLAQALLDKDPVVLGDRDIAMASVRGQDMLGLNLIS